MAYTQLIGNQSFRDLDSTESKRPAKAPLSRFQRLKEVVRENPGASIALLVSAILAVVCHLNKGGQLPFLKAATNDKVSGQLPKTTTNPTNQVSNDKVIGHLATMAGVAQEGFKHDEWAKDLEAGVVNEPFVGASSLNETPSKGGFLEKAKGVLGNAVKNALPKWNSPEGTSSDEECGIYREETQWAKDLEAGVVNEPFVGASSLKAMGSKIPTAKASPQPVGIIDQEGKLREEASALEETESLLDLATEKWGDRFTRAK